MRNKWLPVLAILLTSPLFASLEFTGYFITPTETLFTLTETDSQTSSGWLRAGDVFEGAKVVDFHKDTDVLVLRKASDMIELRLRDSKAVPELLKVTGRISLPGASSIEGVKATLQLDRESIFPLKEGVRLGLKVQRLSDGSFIYKPRFLVKQRNGEEESNSGPAMVAGPGESFAMQVGEYGFSFQA